MIKKEKITEKKKKKNKTKNRCKKSIYFINNSTTILYLT